MPDNKLYLTVDGKQRTVNKDTFDEWGAQKYADAYKGATIRMRDNEYDYDIPIGEYEQAVGAGLRPFIGAAYKAGEQLQEQHNNVPGSQNVTAAFKGAQASKSSPSTDDDVVFSDVVNDETVGGPLGANQGKNDVAAFESTPSIASDGNSPVVGTQQQQQENKVWDVMKQQEPELNNILPERPVGSIPTDFAGKPIVPGTEQLPAIEKQGNKQAQSFANTVGGDMNRAMQRNTADYQSFDKTMDRTFENQLKPLIDTTIEENVKKGWEAAAQARQNGPNTPYAALAMGINTNKAVLQETDYANVLQSVNAELEQIYPKQGETEGKGEGAPIEGPREVLFKKAYDYLVQKEVPASSAMYILSNAFKGSVGGMLGQLGKSPEQLAIEGEAGEQYDASWWEKGVAGAGSIALDAPVFAITGGLGSLGAEAIVGQTAKHMIAKGVAEATAKAAAQRLVAVNLPKIMAASVVSGGINFGGYDVIKDVMNQGITGEQFNFGQTAMAAVGGFAKGGAFGAFGVGAGHLTRNLNGLSKVTAQAGTLAGEIGLFTGMGVGEQLLHGATWEDIDLGEELLVNSAMVGTMKATKPQHLFSSKGKLDENGKMIRNLEFTPEQKEELQRAGFDVKSTFDFAKKTIEGKSQERNELLSDKGFNEALDQYQMVMNNLDISQGTKAKMMYLVEGKVSSIPPVMSQYTKQQREDGRYEIDLLDGAGKIIERKVFEDAKAMDSYEATNKLSQKAQFNEMVQLEQMNDRIVNSKLNQETIRTYSYMNGVTVESITDVIAKKAQGKELTQAEQAMLSELNAMRRSATGFNEEMSESYLRVQKERTGIDITKAILKDAKDRTTQENEAIANYLDFLRFKVSGKEQETQSRGHQAKQNTATTAQGLPQYESVATPPVNETASPRESADVTPSPASPEPQPVGPKPLNPNSSVEDVVGNMRQAFGGQKRSEILATTNNHPEGLRGYIKQLQSENANPEQIAALQALDDVQTSERTAIEWKVNEQNDLAAKKANKTTRNITRVEVLTQDGMQQGNITSGAITFNKDEGVETSDNTLYFTNDAGKVYPITGKDIKILITNQRLDEVLEFNNTQLKGELEKELQDRLNYAPNIPAPEVGESIPSNGVDFVIVDATLEGVTVLDRELYDANAANEKKLINASLKDGVQLSMDEYKSLMTDAMEGGEQLIVTEQSSTIKEEPQDQEISTVESVAPVEAEQLQTALSRIPTNEEGQPIFESAPAKDTWEALLEINEGDKETSSTIASSMIEKLNSDLEKSQKAGPKGNNPMEMAQSVKDNKAQQEVIKKNIDYWNGVISVSTQLPVEEQQSSEPYKEVVLKDKAPRKQSLRYSKQESSMGDPMSMREAVLRDIATGRIRFKWGDNENGTKGLGAHLGLNLSEKERKRRFWALSKDGEYPEVAALRIAEELSLGNIEVTDQDVFNEILDVMRSYDTPSAIWEEVKNMQSEINGEYEDTYEDYFFRENGVTVEDLQAIDDARNGSLYDLDIQRDYDIFADELNNTQNNELQRQGTGSDIPDRGREQAIERGGSAATTEVAPVLQGERPIEANQEGRLELANEGGKDQISNASVGSGTEDSTGQAGAVSTGDTRVADKVNGEIDARLQAIDKELQTTRQSLDAEKKKLGKRIGAEAQGDLFGTPKTDGALFAADEIPIDYSGEIIEKALKPINDKITLLEQEKKQLTDNREKRVADAVAADKAQYKIEEKPSTPSINKGEGMFDYAARIAQQQELDKVGKEVNPDPSDAQKEAGNYKKGHIKIDGLDVSIETPKGAQRSGVDADGKAWSITAQNDYGYIRRTTGADGEQVDVYFGNTGAKVFVVDQVNKDGSFDEHKVMHGFNSLDEAKAAYLSNYEEGWQGLGAINEVEDFKGWLKDGDTTKLFAPTAIEESKKEDVVYHDVSAIQKGEDILDYANRIAKEEEAKQPARPSFIGEPYSKKHDKTSADIHIAPITERVSNEVFADMKQIAKESGGRYSNYISGKKSPTDVGFVFKTPEKLNEFITKLNDKYAQSKGEATAKEKTILIEQKEPTIQQGLDNKKSAETVNKQEEISNSHGLKIGDKVLFKGKEAKIYDIDMGRPVIEGELAPIMYELANWEDVQPMPQKAVEKPTIEKPVTQNKDERTADSSQARGLQEREQSSGTNRQSRGKSEKDLGLGGKDGQGHQQPDSRRVDRGNDGDKSLNQTGSDRPSHQSTTGLSNERNNRSERGVDYAPTSTGARHKANIEAIELAQDLANRGDVATPAEMQVLRKFSGWGGLGGYFNNPNSPEAVKLKELLGEDGYEDASMSINSAYFTPATVVDALWDITQKLGFRGGNILEGSAGIGNILGLMPNDISAVSSIHAVEKDSTTGQILSQLYPDAKVDVKGFEDTNIKNGSVDLAITNVPFITGLHVHDKVDKDLSKRFKNIHDFCIAKNVSKLKPGGLGIFISSNGTLDKSTDLRQWLNTKGDADIIGAFRLHNGTFGGTNATSDIIVVRKRIGGKVSDNAINALSTTILRKAQMPTDKYDWRKEEYITKDVVLEVNSYFAEHPENMAGEMMFGFENGDTYRPESVGLYPSDGKDQSAMLQQWVSQMKAETNKMETATDAITPASKEATTVGEGSLLVGKDGDIMVSQRGEAVSIGTNKNKVKGYTKAECLGDYSRLKDALDKVLDYQQNNSNDAGLNPLIEKLNEAYDTFVSRYGNLNKNTSISFLKNDVNFPSIAALESYSESQDINGKKKVTTAKTNVFTGRVIGNKVELKPTTVKDGVVASIYRSGGIDLGYIADKLGMSEDNVRETVVKEGIGFVNPESGAVEVRHEYLSGNVREKLAMAIANNADGEYNENIKELEKVIPMDIPAHLIDFSLGSSWLDTQLYKDYLKDKFGVDTDFQNIESVWIMGAPSGRYNETNRNNGVYSDDFNEQVYGDELVLAAMNNKQISFRRQLKHYDGSTETIVDKKATEAAQIRIQEIKDEFKEWGREKLRGDEELAEKVARTYNDKFNAIVPKFIDNAFLPERFEGASTAINLNPHQKRGAVRATTEPLLLAHEVGTGKTFTLITAAMEMRRLGTAKKPMIVVQNATVGQFINEVKKLYPNAKVLTLTDRDRTPEGRRSFYAKIKYNDWDLIIVPQSTFEMIPDSQERQESFVKERIEEKLHAIEALKTAEADSRQISALEKEVEKLQEELASGLDAIGKKSSKKNAKGEAKAKANAAAKAKEQLDRRTDDVQDFDDMGIDALLVDEAHEYKRLGFATTMTRGVKGIDPAGSKKAASVYLKTRAVFDKTGWKNVVFATGTPISNTAAEIWTFMRYMMPKEVLKANDIYYFDDFVRNFGNIAQSLEFTTSGKFKENNRFAAYVNKPELIRLWSAITDTVLTKDAGAVSKRIPAMESGKAQDIYLPQSNSLIDIMRAVRGRLEEFENMTGKEKKANSHIPLTMYGIAKRAAIDTRLVDRNAPDEPNSKTNKAVEATLQALEETKDYKGTVAIFCDSQRRRENGVVTFDLFQDIKEKLEKLGVPADQIFIMAPGLSIPKKEKVFADVNAGNIRVIIGNTQTMGTGVNINERLHTLIHMDAPDRPMDYTQRNGRILRQGNLHKDWGKPVRILRFGVEDSLDVTSYQRLKTKSGFIDSIMDGKGALENNQENRTLEEEEEGLFDNPVAVLSGSQYAMLKNKAERDLRKYKSKKQQWQTDQIYIASKVRSNLGKIKGNEELIEEETKMLQQIESSFPNGEIQSIVLDGQKTKLSGLENVLKDKVNKQINEFIDTKRKDASFNTGKLQFKLSLNGVDFNITVDVARESIWDKANAGYKIIMRRSVSYSSSIGHEDVPVMGGTVRAVIDDILDTVVTGSDAKDFIGRITRVNETMRLDNELMKAREGKPFEFEAELKKADELVEEYTELMRAEMAEKEAKYKDKGENKEVSLESEAEEDSDIRFREEPTETFYSNAERATQVNEQFNTELQQQIDGTLPKDHVYQLGEPSEALLSAGMANLRIELTAKILGNKSNQSNHPFDLSNVVNLPEAIHNPIGVFHSKTQAGSKVILTELSNGEKNFIVAVNAVNKLVSGEKRLEINEIRSLYPKDTKQIVNWVNEGKYLSWVDKEKAINWLNIPQFNSEDDTQPNNSLDSVTKIIESFENPTTKQGEIVAAIDEVSERLNTPVNIITDLNQLPKNHEARKRIEAGRGVKGWYEKGKINIYLPNSEDANDAKVTMLHEVEGHANLRQLWGDKFNSELFKVYKFMPAETQALVKMEADDLYGGDIYEATEEYISKIAQNEVKPSWWRRALSVIRDFLRKIGFDVKMSDKDIEYIIWKGRQERKKNDPFAKAHDISMRVKCGVGEYAKKAPKAEKEKNRFRETNNERPIRLDGESIKDYTKRLAEWKKEQKLREQTIMNEDDYVKSMANMMGVSEKEARDLLFNGESDKERRAGEAKKVNAAIREAEENRPEDPESYLAEKAAISGLSREEKKAFQKMANDMGIDTSVDGLKRAWRDEIILRRRFIESENLALSYLIDDIKKQTTKKEREEIPFIIEGSSREGVSSETMATVEKVKAWFDSMYDELVNNGVGYGCKKLDNYVTHIWDFEASDPIAVESYNNRLKMRSPYTKQRVITSLAEGMEMGLVPRFTDITDIMRDYGQVANLTIANKHLLDFMRNIRIEIESPMPAVVPLLIPSTDTNKDYVYIDNETLADYRVHRSMANRVETIFGSGAEWRRKAKEDMTFTDKFWKVYDKTGSTAKRVTLSLSFFHAGALAESGIAAMNPLHFSKVLLKNMIYDSLFKGELPTMVDREVAMDAVKHMVQLGASSDYDAKDVGTFTGKIARWAQRQVDNNPNLPTKTVKLLADIVDGVNTGMDKFLWNYLHDSLKMYTYKKYADEWRNLVEKKGYSPEDAEKGLNNIGQMINDQFGGQHWELLNITPGQLLAMKRVLLSPDWNLSTVRQFAALSGKMSFYDGKDFDAGEDITRPFQRKKAAIYWTTAMLFFGTLMNGINALFRERDEEKEKLLAEEMRKTNPDYRSPYEVKYPNGMKWYDYTMYGNTRGKHTDLFLGRSKEGSELYARWGKQFREVIELIYGSNGFDMAQNVIDKVEGKANPVFNMLSVMANGQSLGGYVPQELRDEEKKGAFSKWGARVAYTISNSFIPWSVGDFIKPDTGKDWDPISLVMPTSKGMSAYKVKRLMEDGLMGGDISLVEAAYDGAVMNKLDADKLLSSAISSVEALNKKEYSDGITTIQEAVEAFENEADSKKRNIYKNKVKKFLAEEDYKPYERDEAIQKVLDYIEGVSEGDAASEEYAKHETFEDIRDEYTISKIMRSSQKVYNQMKEMQENEDNNLPAFIKQNQWALDLYREAQSVRSVTNTMKKALGRTKDVELMNQIRDRRGKFIDKASQK